MQNDLHIGKAAFEASFFDNLFNEINFWAIFKLREQIVSPVCCWTSGHFRR